MPHYNYIQHSPDDYDANRKLSITDEQLIQMQTKLLADNQTNRRGFLILWGITAILMVLQVWVVALPMFAFAVLMSLVYPRLTRRNLSNLETVTVQSLEGRVRMMNKEVRKPNDPVFLQLRHVEIDFNFHVPSDRLVDFNEADTYRIYYTESPDFVLSVEPVDASKNAG